MRFRKVPVQKVPAQILRSDSGRLQCRRCWRRRSWYIRFRCRYWGQVPESSGIDIQVSSWQSFPGRAVKNEKTQKNFNSVGDGTWVYFLILLINFDPWFVKIYFGFNCDPLALVATSTNKSMGWRWPMTRTRHRLLLTSSWLTSLLADFERPPNNRSTKMPWKMGEQKFYEMFSDVFFFWGCVVFVTRRKKKLFLGSLIFRGLPYVLIKTNTLGQVFPVRTVVIWQSWRGQRSRQDGGKHASNRRCHFKYIQIL